MYNCQLTVCWLQCEAELVLLREQLAGTQRMLYDTQQRLLAEEQQRDQVVAPRMRIHNWQSCCGVIHVRDDEY